MTSRSSILGKSTRSRKKTGRYPFIGWVRTLVMENLDLTVLCFLEKAGKFIHPATCAMDGRNDLRMNFSLPMVEYDWVLSYGLGCVSICRYLRGCKAH